MPRSREEVIAEREARLAAIREGRPPTFAGVLHKFRRDGAESLSEEEKTLVREYVETRGNRSPFARIVEELDAQE